jgi:hypothetical protein
MKTNEGILRRLRKDRSMTTIIIRVPEDVIEDLKKVAPELGFSGYQQLIWAYVGQGLRREVRPSLIQIWATCHFFKEADLRYRPRIEIQEGIKQTDDEGSGPVERRGDDHEDFFPCSGVRYRAGSESVDSKAISWPIESTFATGKPG